jgi:D-serine deaminase-like pyridoxal phosphate-dependent protein
MSGHAKTSFEDAPATPYVRIDLGRVDAAIDRMADHARSLGVALRPHAKTHKSIRLGHRQRAAGAVGLTVATVGEAEVFAEGGCDDLFIAYPLWIDAPKARRLARVMDRARVAVGVDSVESVAAMVAHGIRPEVVIEVDSGHHRSGVAPGAAGTIARYAADAGFRVRGAFTFPGHSYAPQTRASAAVDEASALLTASDAIAAVDLDVAVRSGGSTPSAEFAAPGLTELRPGVYVFGDAQQVELGSCQMEDVALTVVATVVSHAGGRVILDAGGKALGADRAPWSSGHGRLLEWPDARIVVLSEHHATVEWGTGERPQLGSQVLVVPNHVCATVNLADSFVVAGSSERWRVDARGKNS